MKWPADQVEIMRSGFEQLLSKVETQELEFMRDAQKNHPNPMSLVYMIASQVRYDLQYDDNHPAYHPGCWENGESREPRTRMVAYNPNFVLYPKGCNDDHMKTMIQHVAKQFNLL